MFLESYQLKEQPFGVTPNPRYLYLGESHREALASLYYGVSTGRGLLALIAPPGMGKTTLLFRLLGRLRNSARTVFLFQTQCDSKGLLRYILGDLGINTEGQDFVTMHDRLNAVLVEEARAGRRFVLVIDEAQNLSDEVLETARLLSDFETPTEKLMQIIFAGQPQLAEKLNRPDLMQLRQRISFWGRLRSFSAEEVRQYIDHRLEVAGYGGRRLFTPAAIEVVAFSSEGIPRNINNICFHALSVGYAAGRREIDVDIIYEVAADLELRVPTNTKAAETQPFASPAYAETEMPAISQQGISASLAPLKTRAKQDEPDSQDGLVHRVDGRGEVLLESMEEAQVRGADILAEVVDAAIWFEEAAPKTVTDCIDFRYYLNASVEDAPDDSILVSSTTILKTSEFGRVRSRDSATSAFSRNDLTAPSITYVQESKSGVTRWVLVAAIFILTALGALLLRQDFWGLFTHTATSGLRGGCLGFVPQRDPDWSQTVSAAKSPTTVGLFV